MATDGSRVLARLVDAVNASVSGDVDGIAGLVTRDCVLRFEGIPVGPFEGRDAVVGAYRDSPPDDEIVVREATFATEQIEATYAWSRSPERAAGRLVLSLDGELIRDWTVHYWSD